MICAQFCLCHCRPTTVFNFNDLRTQGGIFTTPGDAYTTPVDMWVKALGTSYILYSLYYFLYYYAGIFRGIKFFSCFGSLSSNQHHLTNLGVSLSDRISQIVNL
jgi:hypothetical protein